MFIYLFYLFIKTNRLSLLYSLIHWHGNKVSIIIIIIIYFIIIIIYPLGC